MPDAYAPAPLK